MTFFKLQVVLFFVIQQFNCNNFRVLTKYGNPKNDAALQELQENIFLQQQLNLFNNIEMHAQSITNYLFTKQENLNKRLLNLPVDPLEQNLMNQPDQYIQDMRNTMKRILQFQLIIYSKTFVAAQLIHLSLYCPNTLNQLTVTQVQAIKFLANYFLFLCYHLQQQTVDQKLNYIQERVAVLQQYSQLYQNAYADIN